MAKWFQRRGYPVNVICVEDIVNGPLNGLAWEDTLYEGLAVRRLSYRLADVKEAFRWNYDNPWIGAHLRDYLAEIHPDIFLLVSGYLMSGSAVNAANQLGIFSAVYLTDFWFLCPRIIMLRSNDELAQIPPNPVDCAQCLGEEKRRFRWLRKAAPGLAKAYWAGQTERIDQVRERAMFLQQVLDSVDLIISPSEFLRSVYSRSGTAMERILYIRQGLEKMPDLATLKHETTSVLRLGYLGQIAHHKGVHLLIEAVRSMPDLNIEVSIYGDETAFPQYSASLRKMIGDDTRIRMAGVFRSPSVFEDIMRGMDALVITSMWYENSPTVILEAFSYGIPVIAADLGGMAELVQHGKNGLNFHYGDSQDLARQIRSIVDSPGLLPELRRGIDPVKTVDQEMDEIVGLLQQKLEEKVKGVISQ